MGNNVLMLSLILGFTFQSLLMVFIMIRLEESLKDIQRLSTDILMHCLNFRNNKIRDINER